MRRLAGGNDREEAAVPNSCRGQRQDRQDSSPSRSSSTVATGSSTMFASSNEPGMKVTFFLKASRRAVFVL